MKKTVKVKHYTRDVPLQTVTFTCADCRQTFTREQYPGRTPERCEECAKERRKKLDRERKRAKKDDNQIHTRPGESPVF